MEVDMGDGEPMERAGGQEREAKAPPLLLANAWAGDVDLTGWWMSEKLEGLRAYWDGGRLLSRLGDEVRAPSWFLEGLPVTPLDGVLWGGRRKRQRTTSIARQEEKSAWKELSFVVFDAPAMDAPFEQRLAACEGLGGYARHHAHQRCMGAFHLRSELGRVEALGGQGLMLRRPRSRYEVGRSTTLLKVKTSHDAEALVVGYDEASTHREGRHKGRIGGLIVEMADGTRFTLGLQTTGKKAPPPIGALVIYRYQELEDSGVPRAPSYVGIAPDTARQRG